MPVDLKLEIEGPPPRAREELILHSHSAFGSLLRLLTRGSQLMQINYGNGFCDVELGTGSRPPNLLHAGQ